MIKKIKLTGLAFIAMAVVTSAAALMPAQASAVTCTNLEIRRGSSYSDCVRHIQTIVDGIGNSRQWYGFSWLNIDGSFGPATETQVKKFQGTFDNLTADGRVGQNTWKTMCRLAHNYWIGMGGGYTDYKVGNQIIVEHYWVANNTINAANAAGCDKFDGWYNTF